MMAVIGNTFSGAVLELIAFCVVMFALFAAFATFFNITMSKTGSKDYGTFGDALKLVTIDGMVGNMDSDIISRAMPILGPIFYAAYLFSLLFVGFTILISIISDSYIKHKSVPLKNGVMSILGRFFKDKIHTTKHEDEDLDESTDDDDDDLAVQNYKMRMEMKHMAAAVTLLTQKIESMDPHLNEVRAAADQSHQAALEPTTSEADSHIRRVEGIPSSAPAAEELPDLEADPGGAEELPDFGADPGGAGDTVTVDNPVSKGQPLISQPPHSPSVSLGRSMEMHMADLQLVSNLFPTSTAHFAHVSHSFVACLMKVLDP